MYSTALQGGPGADSKRRRARCAQGASRRNAPRSDHIVSGRVRRDHPVGVSDEDLGVPLDEMDEGDVRHTAASVKVSDAADPKASHSRSCDSTDRLHHGSLVAPHTAKPRRWGKCDAGRCVAIATGLAENTCPPMSAFHPMPTVNSRLEICREVPRTDIADTE